MATATVDANAYATTARAVTNEDATSAAASNCDSPPTETASPSAKTEVLPMQCVLIDLPYMDVPPPPPPKST